MINIDNGYINADCLEAMRAGRTPNEPAGRQIADSELPVSDRSESPS